jgi:N-acetylglutamate synthase-like GNAT family acetyltransferase
LQPLPTFTIRAARAADGPAIRWLVRTGRINPTGLDWRRFVVAVAPQGELIGCGQVKPHRDGSRELASIAVSPDWRGRGVARAIIEGLLEAYPGELYLMCRAELEALYARFGFRAIGPAEMPRYFRRISRLAGLVEGLRGDALRLLVMKRSQEFYSSHTPPAP